MAERTIVCFDLGGVLLQINHTWEDACRKAGISHPHFERSPFKLTEVRAFEDYQSGSIDELEYGELLASELGLLPEDALLAHDGVLEADYPGAFELVKELNELGVITCCFSNTNERHWKVLTDPERHPAICALRHRFASHELRAAKPDPAAFEEVRKCLPRASRIAYFEDSAENVLGATKAGWMAFRVDPFADPVAEARRTLEGLGVLGHVAAGKH